MLGRLFEASRAYYLMKETGDCGESTREEIIGAMAAALVEVKILYDPPEEAPYVVMSGEVYISAGLSQSIWFRG